MKLTFSAEHVATRSFLELCSIASDYGYAGFEIYDADGEKHAHEDSIPCLLYTSRPRQDDKARVPLIRLIAV